MAETLTEAERQQCAEARICAMTQPASARQIIKELLAIIDRLTLPSRAKDNRMKDILYELRDRAKWQTGGLLYCAAADEIERLRKIAHEAERELENVLVSIYKLAPDKIQNPVLKRLKELNGPLGDDK